MQKRTCCKYTILEVNLSVWTSVLMVRMRAVYSVCIGGDILELGMYSNKKAGDVIRM